MNRRALLSNLALLSAIIAPSSPGEELKTTFQAAGQTITLELKTQKFDLAGRTLHYQPTKEGGRTLLLDGVEVVGTDLLEPTEETREFCRFRVRWNVRDLPVDPKLYRGFLNPHLNTQLSPGGYAPLKIIVDPSGEWLQILMFGADGGGSYAVAWLLRKDGRHELCDAKVFEFSH